MSMNMYTMLGVELGWWNVYLLGFDSIQLIYLGSAMCILEVNLEVSRLASISRFFFTVRSRHSFVAYRIDGMIIVR